MFDLHLRFPPASIPDTPRRQDSTWPAGTPRPGRGQAPPLRRWWVCLVWIWALLASSLHAQSSGNSFAQWPELQKGNAPDTVFHIENLDSVNLLNGNLTLDVPLGQTYPVGPSFSYGLRLVYNANPWEAPSRNRHRCTTNKTVQSGGNTEVDFHPKTLNRVSNAGPGWMVSLGRFEPPEGGEHNVVKPPFTYIAADGRKHGLHPTLHYVEDVSTAPTDPNVYYSRDGSFLRMIDQASCMGGGLCRRLEFPDGSFHELKPEGADPDDYRPTRIVDAFGNEITVTYQSHAWILTDDHGRTQRVEFDAGTPARAYSKIDRVVLSAFNNQDAVYSFHYDAPQTLERHQYDSVVNRDVSCTAGTIQSLGESGLLGPTVTGIEMLQKVVLPDGSFYEMDYYTADGNDYSGAIPADGTIKLVQAPSGSISHLRLPSGLHYDWWYTPFYGSYFERPSNALAPHPEQRVFGVAWKQRYVLTGGNQRSQVVTWDYHSTTSGRGSEDPAPGNSQFTPCYRQTDVRFIAGDSFTDPNAPLTRHSRHYFSSARSGPAPVSFQSRQSLPFTVCSPYDNNAYYTETSTADYNDGLFLSQEILDPASGQVLRSVWVDYETDAPIYADDKDGDRRLVRRRTVYHDDGDRWVETRYDDFDGLGHFRKTVGSSSFEGTPTKTSYTAYNPTADGGGPSGPDFVPASTDLWLLGLYDETCVHQGTGFSGCGTAQERSLYLFDPGTGFLWARRDLRGSATSAQDVLVRYQDHELDGFPDTETYWGGDPRPGESGLMGSTFFAGGSPVDFEVRHNYRFGALERSTIYENGQAVLETLDQGIDQDTGLPWKTEDPSGLVTYLDFDTMGRLTRSAVDSPNVAARHFRYTVPTEATPNLTQAGVQQYCAEGGCPLTPLGMVIEMRDCPSGSANFFSCSGAGSFRELRSFYDRQGRLVEERKLIPSDGGGTKEVLRQNAYDLSDRKIWDTEWHAPGSGFDVFYNGYLDHDAFDRPRTVRRPDGEDTTFTYVGDRITESTVGVWTGSGESPSVTTERRDGFGRLVAVTEPSGTGGAAVHTTYAYDVGDRLTRVCVNDSDTSSAGSCPGQARTFTYDGLGRLLSEEHPEIDGPVDFYYDAAGTLWQKDASGTAHDLTYVHDGAGRVTQVLDGDGMLFQEYFYARSNVAGRRTGKLYQARRHNWIPVSAGSGTLVDHVVTETYDYSAPGNRLAAYTVRAAEGPSLRTEYTYDPAGTITRIDYPECDRGPCAGLDPGPNVDISRVLGQVTAMPGWIDSVSYHAGGNIHRLHHSNGVIDEIRRDPNQWKPVSSVGFQKDGASLWDSGAYLYDGAGNLYQVGSETFAYDRVHRLTAATVTTPTGTRTESATYDVYGNVTTFSRDGEAQRQLVPSSATNRLSASVASYDVAGNVVSWTESAQTYTYDYAPDNRITVLEGSGKARAFLYTASGERLAVIDQVTGEETYTPRDPGNGLLSRFEKSAAGDWERAKDYVRVGSKTVGTVADGLVRHLHLDHLGSTRLITDGVTGAPVGQVTTHLPFGAFAFDGAPDAEEHRFTGHERDSVGQASAALDYMHARYYAPSVGRFLSVDPVLGSASEPQSWNRYSYVQNNPLGYVDPDGRIIFGVLKKAGKLALKGGDVAATFKGVIDDVNTLRDPDAGFGEKAFAVLSLASEVVSPVSIKDGKAIGKTVNSVIDGGADVSRGKADGAVTLWKAPQRGRTGAAEEVTDGFDPARYPGDGPFFSRDKATAQKYQYHYENGLQEIHLPQAEYDRLVKEGVIRTDSLENASVHVPEKGLDAFNEAIKEGPPNAFHPR